MPVEQPRRRTRDRTAGWPVAALLGVVLGGGMAPAPAAVDAVLVLDNSGSMRENDPSLLTRLAAQRFIERVGDDARVAVLAFDEEVRWLWPLRTLDAGSKDELLSSLDALDYAGQLTDSAAALERAIYELRTNARADADRAIVFLTDGIVDTGDRARDADKARWIREDLSLEAAASGIRIFGVAFTEGADFELIQALSLRTDGAYYRAFSAGDVDGVFTEIVEALAPQAEPAPPRIADAPPAPTAPRTSLAADGLAPDAAPAAPVPGVTAPGVTASVLAPTAAAPGVPARDAPARDVPARDTPARDVPAQDVLTADFGQPRRAGAVPDTVAPDTAAPDTSAPDTIAPAADPLSADPSAGLPAAEPTDPVLEAPRSPPAAAAPDDLPREAAVRRLSAAAIAAGAALLALLAAAVLAVRKRKRAVPTPPEPAVPKAYLNDIEGVTGQPSHELGAKLTVVGRMAGQHPEEINYIVIDEATIGRQHALIEFRDHSFWIVDQNSINGTFVNRRRLEGEARLKHGDRVRFHRHEFEFLILEMFETDRTMLSQTVLEERAAEIVESPRRGEASVA